MALISFGVAWPVLRGSWQSTRALGFLQLCSPGRAPGIPDVLGWYLWWHPSAGISADGDIHPSVWHDGTGSVEPASDLSTHICLGERRWRFLLSGEEKAEFVAGLLHYLETWNVKRATTDANVMS